MFKASICLPLFMLITIHVSAQQVSSNWSNFIPRGYDTLATANGDLNKDGIPDKILVLYNEKEDDDTLNEKLTRKLVILFKENTTWKKVAETDKAIMCKQCGGIHGDPFANVLIKNNVLTIQHVGGSNWSWENTHRFRYQNGEFYLIGKTRNSYWGVERCKQLNAFLATEFQDENLVTGHYEYKKMDEKKCQWIKNEKGKRAVKPLIKLVDFDYHK